MTSPDQDYWIPLPKRLVRNVIEAPSMTRRLWAVGYLLAWVIAFLRAEEHTPATVRDLCAWSGDSNKNRIARARRGARRWQAQWSGAASNETDPGHDPDSGETETRQPYSGSKNHIETLSDTSQTETRQERDTYARPSHNTTHNPQSQLRVGGRLEDARETPPATRFAPPLVTPPPDPLPACPPDPPLRVISSPPQKPPERPSPRGEGSITLGSTEESPLDVEGVLRCWAMAWTDVHGGEPIWCRRDREHAQRIVKRNPTLTALRLKSAMVAHIDAQNRGQCWPPDNPTIPAFAGKLPEWLHRTRPPPDPATVEQPKSKWQIAREELEAERAAESA